MWRIVAIAMTALWSLTVLTPAPRAEAQGLTLEGYVRDAAGEPLQGLTVYLAHPAAGRSYPRITDVTGRYLFQGVPYQPDAYYLEVYWGDTLMFREPVTVHGYVRREDIRLG